MNPVISAIMERYSCRGFTGAPPDGEQVRIIAKAAAAAPSAMNEQPWHIIAVTDKALIEEMDAEGMRLLKENDAETYARFAERGGALFYNAPCLFVITSPGADLDVGIVSQNITLAAHALGLGSVICGVAAIPLGGPRGAEFTAKLRFPEGHRFGMAVLVGEAKGGGAPHPADEGKITYIPA